VCVTKVGVFAWLLVTRTPGLTAVPTAATILGHPGVGVRWRLATGRDKGSTYTLVFDRHTYQLLGMNWTGSSA
jgi:hypothetical protein